MSEPRLVDVTGRMRSPAATPGHWAGCAPPNKGQRYPADPPTVEEIILVMRQAGPGPYADRTRALIAILSSAGLRISEALALHRDRPGPEDRISARPPREGREAQDGRDGRLGLGSRLPAGQSTASISRSARCSASLPARRAAADGPRPPPAASFGASRGRLRSGGGLRRTSSGDRDGARGDPAADYSEAARACPPRDYLDLPPGNRHPRDRRHGAPPPTAGDPGERRPAPIIGSAR
jgi:hypothetical protein